MFGFGCKRNLNGLKARDPEKWVPVFRKDHAQNERQLMPKLKRSDGDERATDFVESLDRGLRLLQKFGATSGPMTLSDLARAADLPRATARRILFTLERGGFVSSDGKLFSLTPYVLRLAGAYLRSNQVVSVLQPVLDHVATAAQEISSLAVLDGDEVVFIARGSPARVFSTGLEIGYRLPAFCTSVGRAMLSRFDDAELAKRLKAMRREALTPHTVTDPKKLLATISADRERGYSLVDREAEPHFRSISVPVRRYDGTIVAAINMGAHVDRVPVRELTDRFLPLLREGAGDVRDMLL
jgi:IclR family transcriptional regulator, pca regulon regulatory protein